MSTTSNVSAGKRIEALLDDNSFVEIGNFVKARNTDFNLPQKETPADGVITGYGVINDNLVYVYSQDVTVLGGSVGEMHAKKIARIYDMAIKMGAPVVGLIDCAGLRLQEATDALNAFGELYLKQTMASGVVPQITAVFGNCGGGLAIMTELSDFTFMTENGHLYVNSPNVLDGNYKEKCDTSSSEFQTKETGNADYVGEESEVIEKIRELVSLLPPNNEDDVIGMECTDDLNRLCDGIENCTQDVQAMLKMVSDNGVFFETKKDYATEAVTGFIKLNDNTVGVIANNSDLISVKSADKMEQFVNFCDAFNIPLVTFTNVTGFDTTVCQEKKMAKAAARLTYAFGNATVPKINVVTENAFGSAYVIMNSRGLGADIVYAWPDSKIGMMNSESAVKIMYADKLAKSDNASDIIAEKASEYDNMQLSANSAASHGYVDDIINPADTRKYLIGALEMLLTKREERPLKKHGTI